MLLPDKKDSVLQWKHLQLVSELMDGLHKVNTVWKRLKQTRARGVGGGVDFLRLKGLSICCFGSARAVC